MSFENRNFFFEDSSLNQNENEGIVNSYDFFDLTLVESSVLFDNINLDNKENLSNNHTNEIEIISNENNNNEEVDCHNNNISNFNESTFESSSLNIHNISNFNNNNNSVIFSTSINNNNN